MTTQTSSKANRRLRRAVILTDGPAAEAVAGELAALSQAWLGTEPPLAVVRSTTQGDLAGAAPALLSALGMACDRLASGEFIGKLQAAGYTLARQDEIQLWVIVDITGDLESPPGRLAEMPALLARLADTVWRRMRIHVTTRGLLLAEPAAEDVAAKWARGLVDAGAEQVTIAGPVDAARVSWEPGAWQTRAATALATLFWSEVALQNPAGLASRGASEEGGEPIEVWSFGAAVWQAPLVQIRQHVALRGAMQIVERLVGDLPPFTPPSLAGKGDGGIADDLPPWDLPRLAVAPERHRLTLEGAVPPEPPVQIWGRQRPDWHALPKLPAALRTTTEKRAAQAHEAQYTPRGEWLGGQVAAWQTALEQLRRERLLPAAGWPAVGLYHRELETLAAQLQAACVTIEDWLEEAGQRFAGAAAAATRAQQALEALCAEFPAPTRAAAWATLLRPWRWLEIAWAYWIMLPRHAQKYLDTAYHQGQARWVEANTHALRQAYLAMAQVTHGQQDEMKRLFTALTEAQADLAARLRGLGAAPEPWDEMALQRLAVSLLPEAWPDAWRLAGYVPGTSQVPGTWEHLATTILDWVEERLGELAAWTAADCLANTSNEAELAQRLGSLADTALPLWPGADQEATAALWLIWPARAAEGGFHSAEERLQSALQAWADSHAGRRLHMHAAAGSASAVLVLRATVVTLDGQKREVL